MDLDDNDIKVQAEGFINAAFEGETDNTNGADIFQEIDLTPDSTDQVNRDDYIQSKTVTTQNNNINATAPIPQQNGNTIQNHDVNSLPVQNGDGTHVHSNGVHRQSRTSTTHKKQNNEETPVVFVGARSINVKHETQDYVRTKDGFDNPIYEGQRSSLAGLDDSKGLGDACSGCCNCKCVLIFALIFIILALVAVTLIFLFLPRPREYRVEVVVVLDIPFSPEYENPSSAVYQKLQTEYTNGMNGVFVESSEGEKYNGIEIVKLSPGSVRVESIVKWILRASVIDQSSFTNDANAEVGVVLLDTILKDNQVGSIPVTNAWVVIDSPSVPPDISCPSDIQTQTDPNSPDAVVTWKAPNVTSLSSVVSISSSHQPGGMFPIGRSKVTYTARDTSGNRNQCNFTVIVADTELPNITCPQNIGPLPTDPGHPDREVAWDTPIATDNSAEVFVIRADGSHESKMRAPIGQTVVKYHAFDLTGNSNFCSFTIIIIDTQPPNILCPTNVYLETINGSETAQIGDSWKKPIISDNSRLQITNVYISADVLTNFSLGVTFVTVMATDFSGNTGACRFSVTVEDNDKIPPEIACPEDILTFSFAYDTSRHLSWEEPKVSDNSGLEVNVTSNFAQRTEFPIGVTVVMYTATDFSGNIATCSFNITVEDIYPPSIKCPNDIMERLPESADTVPITWDPPEVSDNTNMDVNVSVSHDPGSGFPSGVTWVTYTGIDVTGNDNQCEFQVTVEDPRCGSPYVTLEARKTYTINSNNYPNRYRSNTNCTWILLVPRGTKVVVSILDFHTERSYDFVTIGGSSSDHDRPTGNDVTRFEGDLAPQRFLVETSTVWMTFYADRGTTYNGFSIEFTPSYPEDITSCTNTDKLLLQSEICNGVFNCPDNSDETICVCSDGEFKCDHGLCMSGDVVCNGVNECGDFSDERYCPPCASDINHKCRVLLTYDQIYYPQPDQLNSQSANAIITNTVATAILDTCHPDAYRVVCHAIYPACPHYGPQHVPCNGFCQEVTAACGGAYERMVGSSWPVNCTQYPVDPTGSNNKICDNVDGDYFNTGICGTRSPNSRIVGGSVSELGKWPWIVSLRNPRSDTNHKCGGTLIGDRWAITAAHCVDHVDEAYVGDLVISTSSSTEVMLEIAEAFSHPGYNTFTNENDFAVLQLSKPVDYTDYIRPLCLATSQVEETTYYGCFIAGWGATMYDGKHSDILMEAPIPMITREQCAEYYSNRASYKINDRMLCAGYEEGRIDSCQGDSGGPLMCLGSDNRWHLLGVTSFGDGCAEPRSPGVYTRVSLMESFIGDAIKQVEDCENGGGYKCKNNKCIPQGEVCDSRFQCSRWEDEQNCHPICSNEGLISLDTSSLIEIHLNIDQFSDPVRIYCVWGFRAPPGYRIVLRAQKYYRRYYDVEIGQGIDPFNASSVVKKLPFLQLDNTAHFSVPSSEMWMTLSRNRIQSQAEETDTMLDVFIVSASDVSECQEDGEIYYNSSKCDGKFDCTNQLDERDCRT